MTNDDDGALLDTRLAAASPLRDRDVDHPDVYAAARALIEELSMTTQVPTSTPISEPAARARGGRQRLAVAGAAAAAVVALGGGAVLVAGGGGSSDGPSRHVIARPVAAIRQDACSTATAWLDATDDDVPVADAEEQRAELEAQLAALEAEAEAAAVTAELEAIRAAAEAEDRAAVAARVADGGGLGC